MALKNIKWPTKGKAADRLNRSGRFKWRTLIGLILMYAAVALHWQWIWGLFMLYWIIPDFFTGATYFIEPITRRENPILYWIILITWVVFSVAMLFPGIA